MLPSLNKNSLIDSRAIRLRLLAWLWLRWPKPRVDSATAVELIVERHFKLFSSTDHPATKGLTVALKGLGGKPAKILETGSSAWGADSTRLLAKYTAAFGGELWSVDIREEPKRVLGFLGENIHLGVSDSVEFIAKLRESRPELKLDFVYLDSFDVDWMNPKKAAAHGFREWCEIQYFVKPGTVVVVDDTPSGSTFAGWLSHEEKVSIDSHIDRTGLPPGKGSLIFKDVAESDGWDLLWHSYNLVLRKK